MLETVLLGVLAAPAIEAHGWVDAYYAANFNQPADGASWISGVGTSAKRANAFGLNLAAVDLTVKPEPVGARLVLGVGSSTEVVHAGEPAVEGAGAAAVQLLIQASAQWQATPKLQFEAGVYPSHIGLEVL